jgi:23S rRNA (uracil1939-C5)-methyltransferase
MSHKETLRIEKLVYGGYGLGRLSTGLVALVEGGLPNEVVEVEAVRVKRHMGFFRLVQVLEPSPQRSTPVCVHFSDCGGCHLQHMCYEDQLKAKKAMFLEVLTRQKGIERDVLSLVSDVLPAPNPLGYRHLMRFHCATDGQAFLGLARRASNEIVPTSHCRIAHSTVLQTMMSLQRSSAWRSLAFILQEVSIGLSPAEGQVVVVFSVKKGLGFPLAFFYEVVQNVESIKACLVQEFGTKDLKTVWLKGDCDILRRFLLADGSQTSPYLQASPNVFVQNNWSVNLSIRDLIARKIGEWNCRSILDLHCGMGNFLLCGGSGLRHLGSDVACNAIADAQKNAVNLGIAAEFVCRTAKNQAEYLTKCRQRFDLVILDPARGGCPELPNLLPQLSSRLIYISCDPPALARDLLELCKKGYKIKEIRLFDMFPQSYHLESMTTLEME